MKNIDVIIDELFAMAAAHKAELLRRLIKYPGMRGHNHQNDRIAAMSSEQVTIIHILNALGYGVPISEIATRIYAPHANVTRTLDRLEKKGLVIRTRGRGDKRQVIVKLTLEGRKAATQVAALMERYHNEMWKNIAPEDKNVLAAILTRILE